MILVDIARKCGLHFQVCRLQTAAYFADCAIIIVPTMKFLTFYKNSYHIFFDTKITIKEIKTRRDEVEIFNLLCDENINSGFSENTSIDISS